MSTVSLPNWNSSGALPPIDLVNPTSANRSPYQVSLVDFVLRFGTSEKRCEILSGMLKYRSALHETGLVTGFQWVDGSFLEDVEHLEDRAPNDVDIVTFFRIGEGHTSETVLARDPDLFDQVKVKEKFKVDAYLVSLDSEASFLVANSTYWYSLWSHRRDFTWKGFVEIDLRPGEKSAIDMLETLPFERVSP